MIRLHIHDEVGEAVVYLDPPLLTAEQRGAVHAAISGLTREQRDFLLARLIRRAADEAAYDRICHERGLLPC